MLIVSHMYVTLDIVIEKVFIKDCLGQDHHTTSP